MLLITLSTGHKSLMERIPEEQTRIRIDPDFYREIDFTFDSPQALERYRDHFIYGYLEDLYKSGSLPPSFLTAPAVQVKVQRVA